MSDITTNGVGEHGNRWRIAAWAAAALLLLVPLVAMQFTDEVAWDPGDFVVAGAMILIAGIAYELTVRRTGNTAYRCAVAVALAGAFILVAVNLAVGVIGSENNDANLMFAGVLAIGGIGAVTARFRPTGMVRTLLVMAGAQVLVAVIALIGNLGSDGAIWPWDVVAATGFFTAVWALSAWLFRSATLQGSAGDLR